MGPQHLVRLSPADVGARVTVRSRIAPEVPGGPTLTDAVGTLLSWEGGILAVRRRDGSVARVAEADLVAAKALPDPPVRPARGT
jgi:hypothetical protein